MNDENDTATKTIEKLGISASGFYRLVHEGRIAHIHLPGARKCLTYEIQVEIDARCK